MQMARQSKWIVDNGYEVTMYVLISLSGEQNQTKWNKKIII